MEEKLINCTKCGSNACSEISDEKLTVYICFGCGFTSNTNSTEENKEYMESVMPELYKALRYQDNAGLNWYPIVINLPEKGLVFADGKSSENWKWSAVPVRKIKQSEKLKFPDNTKFVPNMKKLQQFEESEFMDGLDYIGYFK